MRRRAALLLLAALSLAGAGPAPADVVPATVTEVAPGVFVRVGEVALASPANLGGVANIGFIVGDDAVAVIDSGGSFLDGARLRAAIRARTARPIAYVINTHMHPDHVLGDAAFVADGPAFVGHRHLARALEARGRRYIEANRALIGATGFAGTKIVLPTVAVADSREIDLGNRPLLLTAYPTAHTDNDLTVLDRRTGTLWTGDLLFVDHVPALDGSLTGWLKVIDSLQRVKAARAVPGHGPASVAWPAALAAERHYLATLAAELRRMIAAGIGLRAAAARAGQSERANWRLFDDFNARNATAGYAELEWE